MHLSSLSIPSRAVRRAAVIALLGLHGSLFAQPAAAPEPEALRVAPPASEATTDRLIIKYRDGSTGALRPDAQGMAGAHEVVRQGGLQMRRLRSNALDALVMQLDRHVPVTTARALAREILRRDPTVEYAEPDLLLQPQFVPDDPQYPSQWNHFEAAAGINLPSAWDSATGTGVVVAVIDTGYRPHADLVANLLPGRDFIVDTLVSNDGDGRDASALDPGDAVAAGECSATSTARNATWHGTKVGGIVAATANNASGIAGVAFGAQLLPLRVLGKCGGYTSDIADAMLWAVGIRVSGQPVNATPARVFNLSLGGSGECEATMQTAINKARNKKAVVVVAAGNSARDAGNFTPANCQGVTTVAAIDRSGARASYSNFGAMIDLAAPGGGNGGGILSTSNTGTTAPGADSFSSGQGTSYATPHVAGVAALMISGNPALSVEQVETLLRRSARPFAADCVACGDGVLDAAQAVALAAATPALTSTKVVEVEPNDGAALAQPIAAPSAVPAAASRLVNGTLASATDVDTYLVSVLPGRSLTAYLKPNAQANYDLALYSETGALLFSGRNASLGGADFVVQSNNGTETRRYLVEVRAVSGLTGASGTYQLRLRQ